MSRQLQVLRDRLNQFLLSTQEQETDPADAISPGDELAFALKLLSDYLGEVSGESSRHQSLVEALRGLGEHLGVQRVYFILLSEDGQEVADLCEWRLPRVKGHSRDQLAGTPVTAFPWSMKQFLAGKTVYVADPDELPIPEAQGEQDSCLLLDIRSYVNIPVFYGGDLRGWLGFDYVENPRRFHEIMDLLGIDPDQGGI